MTQGYNESSTQIFYGLSSDTKPTGCDNGSIFIEMDTKIGYIYDAANADWTEIPNGGGSQVEMDYNEATNKPAINDVTLSGNKTPASLGLQTKINSDSMLDADLVDDTNSDNKFVSATDIVNWNGKANADDVYTKTYMDTALAGKQPVIDDLSDIRSGAALGATSLQPSDVKSTYSSSGTDPVNGKAVAAAIGTLDVAAVGGSGSFISGISETNGKISATAGTVDSTPTESSTGLVTSAGIYTDQARQDALEAQDRAALIEVENKGAKNLLKFRDGVSSASAGNVYANINTDGTLSVGLTSGTTATAQLVFTLGAITKYRDKKLVLSGCPAGGNYQSGYALYIANDGATAQADTGSSAILPIVTGLTSSVVALIVRSGTTISSELTFQPMICTKAEWDISQAYVPYGKTNAELTSDTSTLFTENTRQETEIGVVANAGAKNLAVPFNAISTPGITITMNADGSYKFECTDVAENRVIRVANIGNLPSGAYTFSGTTGGKSSTYMLGLYNTSASAVKYQHTNAEETYTGNVSGFSLRVRVISGYSGTFTVYPMLRPAAITDPTFQPYARTNPELTVLTDEDRDALVELVDNGEKNMIDASDFASSTKSGITLTKNADDSFTITGIFTSHVTSFFTIDTIVGTAGTVLAFEGGESGIYAYARNGNPEPWLTSLDGVPITTGVPIPDQNIGAQFGIAIMVDNTDGRFDNIVFDKTVRIMICPAAAYAISSAFVPYRPSWQEMYERIVALESGGNRALTMQNLQPTESTEPEEQEELELTKTETEEVKEEVKEELKTKEPEVEDNTPSDLER